MFTVQQYSQTDSFIVRDTRNGDNLHSDGSIYGTAEYFPTRGIAQAVLDKYPQHEWKHGDVLVNVYGADMIYLVIDDRSRAHCLSGNCVIIHEGESLDRLLTGAKFLFNVNDRIIDDR